MKRLALVCLATLIILSGCGGGGSSQSATSNAFSSKIPEVTPAAVSQPLDTKFNKSWSFGDNEFLLVSTEKALWMSNNTTQNCYLVEKLDVVSSSESSIALENPLGELSQLHFTDNGDTEAIVNIDGSERLASSAPTELISFSAGLPLCTASSAAGKIEAILDLVEVPTIVKVDREASAMITTELDWSVSFDINDSGQIDAGDVSLHLSNIKHPNKSEAVVPLVHLESRLVIYTSAEMGYSILDAANISADANGLMFSVDASTHPLLSLITENTGVYATSSIFYESPETDDLWAGAVDGPWNWTSSFHKDEFPDEPETNGFSKSQGEQHIYSPIYQVNALTDGVNDIVGEANWIDILDLEINLSL